MSRSRGAVACGHAGTAQAALDVLDAGGNAVDGTIAAFFAACVFEPVLASPGGGGFAMCRVNGEPTRILDFFTQTPIRKRPLEELDFHKILVDFGAATQEFHIGLGAAATPGAIKGMFELHATFGSMPMLELVQPALAAIRARPPLCDLQAHILEVVEPIYMGRESARRVFESPGNPGRVLRAGDRLEFEQLGGFLDALAHDGEDLFYRGEVAALVEEQCRTGGGSLGREDMHRYRAEWREPLTTRYRGTRISLNPAPSAGGVLILFGLEMLGCRAALVDDLDYYHGLAEIMALTDAAWSASITPRRPWPELDAMLAESCVGAYLSGFGERVRAWRGTTHISVVDGDDNMVGMTVTNGEGCGEIIPGTGIMFNNMLGEENLNPTGFHAWCTDTRMSSMMAPTLIEWPDGRRAMTGSGGSNRIRTAILQTIVQLVDRAHEPARAVLEPRIHLEDDLLSIEGGVADPVLDSLVERFPRHTLFPGRNFFFGGVHSVMSGNGAPAGAGDPRRAGIFRLLGGDHGNRD